MVELTTAPGALPDLVNRLALELSQVRRALDVAKRKLGATSRTLEGRTQELTEARAALTLLLATLDSTSDGVVAVGQFGRAMHYNARFIELWGIAADRLATLSDDALLALQLTQVKDPVRFLADVNQRKDRPDQLHRCVTELADGRVLESESRPQRVNGRRVGCVTNWRDVTERERVLKTLSQLQSRSESPSPIG